MTSSVSLEVQSAARLYEAALVAGDVEAATAAFLPGDPVSRFGPDGEAFGPAEVAGARAAQASAPEPVWLHEEVRVLGDDVALHLALLDRGGALVQRTQVWVATDDGWRIGHAHVSRRATS